jgi:quercetin dioxygenase-like cupin family protein
VPHWYQNIGEEDFEFLCLIPNLLDEIKLIEKEC